MQHVITPGDQRHMQHAYRCGCGSKSTNGHIVYLGFLEYDKDFKPATGQDAGAGWFNWLSYVMANDPVIHVQIFFVDNGAFLSYSADKKNGVACFTTRGITGKWRFVELLVTEQQELAMRNFYTAQLGKPFSFWGTFWLYTPFPRRTTQFEWFCSELCVAAMQHAGLLCSWRDACTVKPHILYRHMAEEYIETTRIMCECNPAVFSMRTATGTLNFDFGLEEV